MKHLAPLLLLLFSYSLAAQGWIWQSGNVTRTERLKLIWADSDSTAISVGDSAGWIIHKRLNYQGQILTSQTINTLAQNGEDPLFFKKDFGFFYLNKRITYNGWTAYATHNLYQLHDAAGNLIVSGDISGQNGNDYTVQDAQLTPDSAVLVVGVHLNSDERKLYLRKIFTDYQNTGNWIKEIHDSTKNISGLRLFPTVNGNYLVLAVRSGFIGGTFVDDVGFLLINNTGDLLASNWVNGSLGSIGGSVIRDIPLAQDSAGFSLWVNNQLIRFDAAGHWLWTKPLSLSFRPRVARSTADGLVLGGYENVGLEEKLGLATLDPAGNIIWDHRYDLAKLAQALDVLPLTQGGYIAVGNISNPVEPNDRDFFAAKINADGSIFNNLVAGYVFADLNANCLRDAGEAGLTGLNAHFDNGYFNYAVQTDPSGYFEIPSDTGHYILKFSPPPGAYWSACSDSLSGYFPDFHTTDTVYFPFRPTALCPQMRLELEANRIRPCSTTVAYVHWQNIGTATADSVFILLNLPATGTLLSADLPLTDLGNGQYRLDVGSVPMGISGQTRLVIQGDCSLQIGDFLCFQAHIFPDSICTSAGPVDSTAFRFEQERCLEVRNSFDPNEKTAEPTGRSDFHYLPADTSLTYLIRFQNTGTDTAFTVVVRDTLAPALDPFSLQPEIASHAYHLEFQEDGSLKFVFPHILLPDSTTNEAASHGFIRFRVRMRLGLLPLTAIPNRAAIYFDYNPPVLTNTVVRTIEPAVSAVTAPNQDLIVFNVSPNPAHAVFELQLALERPADMRLAVYDVAGRQISNPLLIKQLPAGKHQFSIPADTWPSGVYFLKIQAGKDLVSRKLIKQ